MADLNQLTKRQSTLAKQVKATYEAYKQLAEERKTEKAVQERLVKLQSSWQEFEQRDDEIRQAFPARLDHPYFSENLYDQLEYIYNEFKAELECRRQVVTKRSDKEEKSDDSQPMKLKTLINPEVQKMIRKCNLNQMSLQMSMERIVLHNRTKAYYETMINRLQTDWAKIQNLNEEIHEVVEDPEQYGFDAHDIYELDEKVQEMIIQLKEQLDADHGRTGAGSSGHQQARTAINLPTITIPKFDGDYLKWPQFHDMFSQMIDNQGIEKVEKMWYLKSNLTGEAQKLIKHLIISAENYDVAWKILKERYQNKRLLVSCVLDNLINQPNITSESAKALKTMHDTTRESILMLENIGMKVSGVWDPMLLHILIKKLDTTTHTAYEQSIKNPRELQTLDEFLHFLEIRFQSFEALGFKTSSTKAGPQRVKSTSCPVVQSPFKCIVCNRVHMLHNCKKFVAMTIQDRESVIRKNNLCYNCLRKGHGWKTCRSINCRTCNQKHHTLLHKGAVASKKGEESQASINITNSINKDLKKYVFLGTALVTVLDKQKRPVECRILLDSGSQINLITERLQKRLRLDAQEEKLRICGIGNAQLDSNDRVNIEVQAKSSHYTTIVEAYVVKQITSMQPQRFIDTSQWKIPKRMKLADPNFNKPQKIDILLGAEMYGELMRIKQIKLRSDLPFLQKSVFGWIVLGKMSQAQPREQTVGVTTLQLEEELTKFWEIEEIQESKPLSKVDRQCEEFFLNTTSRDESGRFKVNLPMLNSPELLGESRGIAWRRYENLEKKFSKDPELQRQYSQFLSEYLRLGHMERIQEKEIPTVHYFLPHHAVVNPDKSSTKLRVVFDASCKTTSNLSLNDLMMKGMKVQDDLFDILLRFRTYKHVFMADIKQMYRQIRMADEDQGLQLIMWRSSPEEQIQFYKLTTVTYGTKAAPYLATRCLKQLAEDEELKYPSGKRALKDCYVDDIITGANSLCEAMEIRKQVTSLLQEAQLKLHKWAASDERLLIGVPLDIREEEKTFDEDDERYIKTLGVSWQASQDIFRFTTKWPEVYQRITKRNVISEVARLFDPLGLVNPIIVYAKIFIQRLWKHRLDWDEELNDELADYWRKFRNSLSVIHHIKIQRNVIDVNASHRIEIHAFSDASEKAYGAAIYIRALTMDGRIQTKLLCSKSRVAPVKLITLPRLELCAAQLATKLVQKVTTAIRVKINQTYYWTDSQIVLSWISGDAATFKTYIAHRTAAIQQMSSKQQWNYISSKQNPADILSRGTTPHQLINEERWFWGPSFLAKEEYQWPDRTFSIIRKEDEERKCALITYMNAEVKGDHPIFHINHRNSFWTLQRVLAYMLRAGRRLRGTKETNSIGNWLTTMELEEALITIVKEIQKVYYKDEIQQIKHDGNVKKTSSIASLSPFIDKSGVIRVGGRLGNADITYDAKHPMLLPGSDFVSKLLLDHLHRQHLHVGALGLLAIARQRFWIVRGRSLARATISKCGQCVRCNPQTLVQKMGDLPERRVLPARPFSAAGVDFFGPISTHYRVRGKKPTKSYIAVFCCFTTKAVHMEVVSDLTTDGFLGALRRFTARRGLCKDLHCDNATNFVGAHNKLQEWATIMSAPENQDQIVQSCSKQGIQFHFAPPRSPHFGGLWEAAVKSAKKLLKQTLTSASLTYEELSTVVSEAEAILNSRPLTPMSSDPNDLTALTPGHFLIGGPLTSIPQPNEESSNISALSRWKLVSAINQEFWKRWTKEYLCELQNRYKWKDTVSSINPGMLVIIKDENLPSLKWPMGRIEKIIKGKDGLVRVAIVRTEKGQFKRAIHKLAPLPVEERCSDESMEPSGTEDGRKRKQVKSAITTSTVHKAKKKRITANPVSLLLTLFLCPLITFGTSEPIRVTSITNNAGIYFESVGPGRLITNNWKLIVYYNMSNYWHTRNIIQKGIFRLKGLADATANNESLKAIVFGLDQQLKELEDEDRALVDTPTSQSRVKRGIINIVGNIANKLFGVLDDEYAKNIEATIKNVQGRQDELLRLMRNQTSIIDATIDLMSKNQEERTQQLRKFQHEADVILASMDKMSSEEQRNKLTTTFLTIAQYTVLLLNELQRIQASFWNILTDVHHGNVNPLIVPAERLAKHVKEIQEVMPTDNELPAVDNLYSIMTAKGQMNRQLAMFTLEIPLVSPTKYEVVRTIAFPIRINNSFVRIEPEAEFIMVNDYRDEIYALSEFEYHQCRTFRSTMLLCDQLHPVYTKYASHLQCEFSLLAQQTVSEQCQLRISKPERDWIQLQQRNNWLFSMDKETSYNIVCTSEKFQIQLKDNGILTFLDSCTLRDDHLTIQSYQGVTTKIEQTVQPVIRFPEEWNTTISTLNIPSDIMPAVEKFTARYEVIKKNLNQLKTQEILLTNRATNDQYQMIGGYIVLVIIVLVCALWYLITIIKRKRIISSQRTINIEEGDFNLRPFPQRGGEC